MMDSEKIKKGLAHCGTRDMCDGCPYMDDSPEGVGRECTVHQDALALINVYEQFFASMYQFSNDLVRIATTGGDSHADG